MALLRFFVTALVREERPHVVLFEQCFALVLSSAPSGMEELLVQQLGEDYMLALVLFKVRQGVEAFVNDPGVYPGG